MKHSNISVFIPHLGCPHKCSFCNQNSISGTEKAPSPDEVYSECMVAFNQIENKSETEIAFFGGSFTAIPFDYMTELLKCVQEFIGDEKFKGIRISTRPDCIDESILTLLKKYQVTAIELGVQSMSDDVLAANNRGHTAADVINSVGLIKKYGFELGLQMMVGLYQSAENLDIFTADEIIRLRPDTVRIYPVVILEDTKLAELYRSGEYFPYSIDSAVRLCSDLLLKFKSAGINVIKLGLHASEIVESQLVGGLYHPAFKELCENSIYRKIISEAVGDGHDDITVYVPEKSLSKAIGQQKSNLNYFKNLGINIKIKADSTLSDYSVKLAEEV